MMCMHMFMLHDRRSENSVTNLVSSKKYTVNVRKQILNINAKGYVSYFLISLDSQLNLFYKNKKKCNIDYLLWRISVGNKKSKVRYATTVKF